MQGNLEWFRTFKSIYETGTMSGAAKELYISQPGVGLHLNALEAYTGFPLFERTSRKMVPTEKGQLFYKQIIDSLNNLEEVEKRFKQKSAGINATVSIGMCAETFQQVLEKHIPNLPFNLIMLFGKDEQLIEYLEKGTADLIVTTSQYSNCRSIAFEPFTKERLWLTAGKKTKIAAFNKIDKNNKKELVDWLSNRRWYATAADMATLNNFWEVNFKQRPDFVPNFIVPNKFSIVRCLSSGEGLAILPDFLCRKATDSGKIVQLWSGYKPLENTLYFGKRKHTLYNDEVNLIQKLLREEF